MSEFTKGLKKSAKNGAGMGLVLGAGFTGGSLLGTAASTAAGVVTSMAHHYFTYDNQASKKHSALGKQFDK